VFGQPRPTADPRHFRIAHPSDDAAYAQIDALNAAHKLHPLPFPAPRGLPEPQLTLAQVFGRSGDAMVKEIEEAARIVFHAVGDTGSTRGPETQSLVADKLVTDFDEEVAENRPQFFFHLGDVIYNFGERQYYYDQFYEPYRDYPAPILAIAGNHDGMVAPGVATPSLAAFIDNFCAEDFEVRPEAGGLSRTAQIQPGVFFTFEAPFLRILALYSNALEDPGVIASPEIGDSQLKFLEAALTRVKKENFNGALLFAHHHPAFTLGSTHGWSIDMLAEMDKICANVGVWPHAVLSAHAHNFQRFTRVHDKLEIPYLICGNGGHAIARLKRSPDAGGQPTVAAPSDKGDGGSIYVTPYRAPTVIQAGGPRQGPCPARKLRRSGLRLPARGRDQDAASDRVPPGLGRRRGQDPGRHRRGRPEDPQAGRAGTVSGEAPHRRRLATPCLARIEARLPPAAAWV
jgi:Calcineurin-like phosphoesterase